MATADSISDKNNKFQGYLEKQSMWIQKFRKRWIVLDKENGTLKSYKTDNMTGKPTENIDLRQFRSIEINGNTFTLIPHDTFGSFRTFRSNDESSLIKWVNEIKSHLCDESDIYAHDSNLKDNDDTAWEVDDLLFLLDFILK